MVKNPPADAGDVRDVGLILGQEEEMTWRSTWQPTPVLLPGESHGQRSLSGLQSIGHKESDVA